MSEHDAPYAVEEDRPEVGSLWERNDEVYRIESVYEAHQRDRDGAFRPVTIVKVICVEPMPCHPHIEDFLKMWTPYDPDAP